MSWEPQSSMASLTTNHLWSCTTGRTWTSSVRECFAWCMISSSNLLRWLGWTEKMILFWQLMHCQELKQSLTLRWWVRSPPTPHPPAPLRFHTHWGFLVSIQQRRVGVDFGGSQFDSTLQSCKKWWSVSAIVWHGRAQQCWKSGSILFHFFKDNFYHLFLGRYYFRLCSAGDCAGWGWWWIPRTRDPQS